VKLLITGRGTSGSWKIRGEQLGQTIRATVMPQARDVAGFDLAVVVKRAPDDLLQRLHRAGVPIVYDVVDAWPQPCGNTWGREFCMAWLASEVKRIRPAAIVAATRAMAEDCEQFGLPVLALPHHARPRIARNPLRDEVRSVGYEGGEHYLGTWRAILERECARRGWRFIVNPTSLAELDIVVALREAQGYAPRNWKSGCKLSNAQGSGTPFIGSPEAGYREQASGDAERWVDNERELSAAFDALTPIDERRRVSERLLSAAPRIEAVANTYLQWLNQILRTTG
jgi:hypothetical protein